MEGKITGLASQKSNPERVNVYVDGEFAFGLAAVEADSLRVGQSLSSQQVAELENRDIARRGYERALKLLSYRPRSIAEMSNRLRQAGLPSSATDSVVDRLKGAGLLDDHAFARYWVENREEFRPRGHLMLRWELRQKGVADQIIDEALAPVDEAASACRLARQRAARLCDPDEATFRGRLTSYLSRRGYPYSIIAEVVRGAWEDLSGSYGADAEM